LINPTFTKRDDADGFLILEVTPEFTTREQPLSEKPEMLLGRVQPYKVGKSMLER